MIEPSDISYLDNIYKRKDDCESDMDLATKQIHKMDNDIIELKTQLKYIVWLTAAIVGGIITIVIQNFMG